MGEVQAVRDRAGQDLVDVFERGHKLGRVHSEHDVEEKVEGRGVLLHFAQRQAGVRKWEGETLPRNELDLSWTRPPNLFADTASSASRWTAKRTQSEVTTTRSYG